MGCLKSPSHLLVPFSLTDGPIHLVRQHCPGCHMGPTLSPPRRTPLLLLESSSPKHRNRGAGSPPHSCLTTPATSSPSDATAATMASSSATDPGVRLSDRTRRSSLGLRAMVLLMHVVFVGAVFLLDSTLDRRIHEEPWYIGMYGLLVLITLVLYFCTAGSSPGYVIDAMEAGRAMHATFINTATLPKQSSSKHGSLNSPMIRPQLEKLSPMSSTSSWLQQIVDLYPPGSSNRDWTCTYCKVIQPPRSRHCHDCDKCVLQFDHHCVWLGTCIGKKNHCRFWWYIFEETILCTWTIALYIESLHLDIDKAWWKDFIGVILLAVLIFILIFLMLLLMFHTYIALTNQTTYEVARRKRIFYLRGAPDRVHPFSKGICRNIYGFCFSREKGFVLEAVPPLEELEASSTPYTCRDIICCRCC